MTDKLIFPSRVYILGIWTADLALTSAEVLVSCLLMLMCSWLEMNGSVIGIYLYSSYMAVPPDPGHCTSLRRAPASVRGSQQMTLSLAWSTVQCNVCLLLSDKKLKRWKWCMFLSSIKKKTLTKSTLHLNIKLKFRLHWLMTGHNFRRKRRSI